MTLHGVTVGRECTRPAASRAPSGFLIHIHTFVLRHLFYRNCNNKSRDTYHAGTSGDRKCLPCEHPSLESWHSVSERTQIPRHRTMEQSKS